MVNKNETKTLQVIKEIDIDIERSMVIALTR